MQIDEHGMLDGAIPTEAVEDIARPGPADEAVEYWCDRLDFETVIEPRRELAVDWLRETGGWTAEELAEAETRELAERVLWLAACDIRENGEWLGLVH